MNDINPEFATAKSPPKISQIKNLLYAFGALLLLGITLAWLFTRQETQVDPQAEARGAQPVAGTSAAAFDTSALEARLDDAQQINRVLREQALALSQRMDLLEDTVAGLRRGAAPNAESFKLDEAQYLLGLAETRLDLFSDPLSAVRALELADNLLAGISDPALANVRQTLSIEIDVVRAAPINDVPALSGRLRALIQALPSLPILIDAPSAARSRIWLALDRYLVVRREGEAMPVLGRSPWAVREGLTLEFERAQLALERQQPQAWQNSLETAVAMAERGLKAEDASVESFLSRLRALAKTALAPEPPKLGATLRALRRLREGPARPVVSPEIQPEIQAEIQAELDAVVPSEPAADVATGNEGAPSENAAAQPEPDNAAVNPSDAIALPESEPSARDSGTSEAENSPQ